MSEEEPTPEAPRRGSKWKLLVPVVGVGLFYAGMIVFNLLTKPPADLGVSDGRLAPCPAKPNCVCSQADADDSEHAIKPLALQGEAGDAIARLRGVVEEMPRTSVIEETENYLRAEFTTLLMRYVDDVEFLLDGEAGVIHVRSASRVGYSDMGANRSRVEQIRAKWEAAGS